MWLDGRSTDSYHLVCIAQGTVTYEQVEQKTPQSTGEVGSSTRCRRGKGVYDRTQPGREAS